MEKVNAAELRPGDRVRLKSECRWEGQLAPKGSGRDGAPIVIDRYGRGPRPRIDGAGKVDDAPNQRKDNGGITFRTIGNTKPSRFDGLAIERNIIWKVDRPAIAAQSDHARRNRWFPSLNVVIRDNFVEDAGGDGIVPWATDGVLVEHNIARNCNRRAKSYNAGIWPWSADNSVLQLNEAAFTRTIQLQPRQRGRLPGDLLAGATEGGGEYRNTGTVARRNISRNDKARIFHLSGADQTTIEDNAVYVGEGLDVQMLVVTE